MKVRRYRRVTVDVASPRMAYVYSVKEPRNTNLWLQREKDKILRLSVVHCEKFSFYDEANARRRRRRRRQVSK